MEMETLAVKDIVVGEPSSLPVKKQAQKPDLPQAKKEYTPPESPKATSKADEADLKAMAEGINNFLKKMQYTLQFVVDKKNGDVTIKVMDENGKLIRQIPPEAMAGLSQQGDGTGIILNKTLG
jgi:uncharacterized FlaG/YvyC family protein